VARTTRHASLAIRCWESATVLLRQIAVALVLVVATACSPRSGNPARIATGYISHLV